MKAHKDEQKQQQVNELRGQAKHYTLLGAAAAGAWALAESGILTDALLLSDTSTKTGRIFLGATAVITLGAIIAAVAKHSHADRVEASRHEHAYEHAR